MAPPGVNFTNVLRKAFTLVDPDSIKNTVKSLESFTFSGSACVKAVRRTLKKLSPGVNPIHEILYNSPSLFVLQFVGILLVTM